MAVRVCLYTCVHVFLALRLSVTTGNPEKKQFSVVIEAWPHIGSHTHAYTYMKAHEFPAVMEAFCIQAWPHIGSHTRAYTYMQSHEFPAVMGVFCIQAWPHTGSVIYVHIHGSSCPLGFRHGDLQSPAHLSPRLIYQPQKQLPFPLSPADRPLGAPRQQVKEAPQSHLLPPEPVSSR